VAKKKPTGTDDTIVQAIKEKLKQYQAEHPKAVVDVQRQNSVAVRIRIIDPDFAPKDRVDRDEELWKLLETLPLEVMSDITMLLLLTPKEAKTSFASMEFDNPVPSRLE
jgi:hypothetical protein